MILERVEWDDPRAVALRAEMDAEMTALYASSMDGLSPERKAAVLVALAANPEQIVATVLALDGEEAVGHAALRPLEGALEVKKVFVTAEARGRGISWALMRELEVIASERHVARLVLQTGDRQPVAIGLYEAIGYQQIPVYEPYTVLPVALCYGKVLR
jgi:GNAT superfamily N-acetyltransferase